jgi:SAM-dependent methyltransferase
MTSEENPMTTHETDRCCAPAGGEGSAAGADPDKVGRHVHERYADFARTVLSDGTAAATGCAADGERTCGRHYDADELAGLPESLADSSLGSGHPVAAADLRPGETVVDLGSGSGLDAVLAARAVGPQGRVIGVDATEEMIALATRHVAEAGATNVSLEHASMETLPQATDSVDVVVSNCVINLSVDKPAVFAEIARVLRPGGRLVASDLMADDALSPAERAERGAHAGCIAGALSFTEYRAGLAAAGLVDVDVEAQEAAQPDMYRALVRARRPAGEGEASRASGGAPAEH